MSPPPFAGLGNCGTRVSLRFDSRLDLEAQITSLNKPDLLFPCIVWATGRAHRAVSACRIASALAALERSAIPPFPLLPACHPLPVIIGIVTTSFFVFFLFLPRASLPHRTPRVEVQETLYEARYHHRLIIIASASA